MTGTLTAQAAQAVPPDDPAAVAMFTAHRLDDSSRSIGHAIERMAAARKAAGTVRAYHVTHLNSHLAAALDNGHQLAASVRAHYPAEAAELQQLQEAIGLAKALYPAARVATFAHLLQTILYHEAHAARHAKALLAGRDGPAWDFDADHTQVHLDGAAEHIGKLISHVRDNYPAEARYLARLRSVEAATITGQAVELAEATWVPLTRQAL